LKPFSFYEKKKKRSLTFLNTSVKDQTLDQIIKRIKYLSLGQYSVTQDTRGRYLNPLTFWSWVWFSASAYVKKFVERGQPINLSYLKGISPVVTCGEHIWFFFKVSYITCATCYVVGSLDSYMILPLFHVISNNKNFHLIIWNMTVFYLKVW
jgi:hypothetical protein